MLCEHRHTLLMNRGSIFSRRIESKLTNSDQLFHWHKFVKDIQLIEKLPQYT